MSTQTCHLLNSGQAGKTAPKWAKKYFLKKKNYTSKPAQLYDVICMYDVTISKLEFLCAYICNNHGDLLEMAQQHRKIVPKDSQNSEFPIGQIESHQHIIMEMP